MNPIDISRNFERAGFSRKQAEVQVTTLMDIKKGLMTQEDGKRLEEKFEARFERLEDRFTSFEKKIDLKFHSLANEILIRMVVLTAALLTIIKHWPEFYNWFIN